jgi:peptidoglycan/xylan/chitin deacetylase (PgdA/CDA1 family)
MALGPPVDRCLRSARPTSRKEALRRVAARMAVGLNAVLGSRHTTAFGILTYHRIADACEGLEPPTWNATPKQFRQHMTELLDRGYQAWPLRQVLKHARVGESIPRNAFVVTFDDVFESVYRHAWPVLHELNIPATLFIATAYLDSDEPFPFDDWSGAGSPLAPADAWRPMSTGQCREMLADPLVELGTHTHTHENFRGRPDALRRDLMISLDVLLKRFGVREAPLAFPFGIDGADVSRAAKDAGAVCSLSNQGDLVTQPGDPFAWGRISVDNADTGRILAAKLDGWYTLGRDIWRSLKSPLGSGRN